VISVPTPAGRTLRWSDLAAVEVPVVHGTARALRSTVPALSVCLLLALGVGPLGASPASAATLSIRLEAGPQTGVRFDATWHVTSRRTVTLAAPVIVAGSKRSAKPPGGTWLQMTSGPLAGRWVRESPVAYVTGFAGTRTWSPPRSVTLAARSWELYRFDATGTMLAAKGWLRASAVTIRVDRAAVVRGQRHLRIADGPWAGWWVPGSRAKPIPIACTAGSPPTATSPTVVRAVAKGTGEIALTFDMGGRLTPALSIVAYLELNRVCATIFPTGTMAETETGRAVLAEVAAHPELFEVGNHTVHHCNLRDGGGGAACPETPPAANFVTRELQDADAMIAPLAGSHTMPYWRPPYGAMNKALRAVAADAGYPITVMWSIDTIDWRRVADGGPTAADSAAKVITGRTAGAVVLMHLGGYTTRAALPAMVTGLRAAGYTPTTISALFRPGA
jgi:peptidoglycan/xylan/chitin deacetylase (PgdA/CDA1 family)